MTVPARIIAVNAAAEYFPPRRFAEKFTCALLLVVCCSIWYSEMGYNTE